MTAGSSFVQRILQANLTLTSGTFGPGKGNTVQLAGLRMEAEISKHGHPSKNQLKLKIYGMLEHDMNMLTTLPAKSEKPLAVHKNVLQLLAGDASGMATAFEGEITGAWVDYQSAPGLYFHLEALAGYYPAIKPVAPKSYQGSASVASIMSTLASQMGYQFENHGVKAQLHNPYLPGTAYQQAAAVAEAAGIEFGVDDGILFIAPRGTARAGTAPLISAATGLKGYPTFSKKGLELDFLYNPGVKLGGPIKVQSVIQGVSGTWRVNGLRHHLTSETPGGPWDSKANASWVGN
jgi:hypothetical protein